MTIKSRYILCRQDTSTLDDAFKQLAKNGNTDQPPPLALQDVTALIRNLAFIVEHSASDTKTAQHQLAEAQRILLILEG